MNSKEIFYLDNIIEGYDGLGLVSTVNAALGEVVIHVTPGTKEDVIAILHSFPKKIEIVEYFLEEIE